MDQNFLLVVDLSKIICNGDKYTMLIDVSKMTLVFEFLEWIRWSFSLKKCSHINYMGTKIHEFEDISILSRFTKVEISTCFPKPCNNEMKHDDLIKELKFYHSWHNIKVPRTLKHKLYTLQEKWNKFELQSGSSAANNEVNQNNDFNSLDHSNIISNINSQGVGNENCGINFEKTKINSLPELVNCQNNVDNESDKHSPSKGLNYSFEHLTKEKENENKSENFSKTENTVQNNLSENMTKEGLQEGIDPNFSVQASDKNLKIKRQFKGKRCNNFLKPFTIGELVNNLRIVEANKEPEFPDNAEENPPSDHPVTVNYDTRNDCIKNAEETEETEDLTLNSKKRKRIRKHRSKKKKLTESEIMNFSFSSASSANNTVTYTPPLSNSMAKHIRFEDEGNGNEDEADTESELLDSKKNDLTRNNNEEVMKEVADIQEVWTRHPYILREQVNQSTTCSSKQELNLNIPTSESVNETLNDNNFNNMLTESEINKSANVQEKSANGKLVLHELLSLREKLSSPAVFERFRFSV